MNPKLLKIVGQLETKRERHLKLVMLDGKLDPETPKLSCPKCYGDLVEVTLSGVLVDKCRGCRGIFFDDGELEEFLLTRVLDSKVQ